MTTVTETHTLTITLTGRPPVRIRVDHWPVIAMATYKDWDGQHEFQANRTTRAEVYVRQHADGRRIVYATYDYTSAWQNERDYHERAGQLVSPDENLARAIEQVCVVLKDQVDTPIAGLTAKLARECIADLPAEDI